MNVLSLISNKLLLYVDMLPGIPLCYINTFMYDCEGC